VPATRRLTKGDRAFAVAGPQTWNSQPETIHWFIAGRIQMLFKESPF